MMQRGDTGHKWRPNDDGRSECCARCGIKREQTGRQRFGFGRKVYAYAVQWPSNTGPLAGTYLKVAKMPPCKPRTS